METDITQIETWLLQYDQFCARWELLQFTSLTNAHHLEPWQREVLRPENHPLLRPLESGLWQPLASLAGPKSRACRTRSETITSEGMARESGLKSYGLLA
jgi:hypothetical protein